MSFVSRWWSRTRALVRAALTEQSSPPKVGAALALGALIGSSPLLGLHSLLGVGLSSALKLNRVLTFVGTNVSVPPVIIGVVWGEIAVGSAILGRPRPHAGGNILATAKGALATWWLGWAAVGPVLAAIFYVLGVYLARRWHRGRETSEPPAA